MPCLSSVILAMDTIDCTFMMASMDGTWCSLPMKVALDLGKRILNKYYNLTDESEIYRASIGMLCIIACQTCLSNFSILVLHPGLKAQYFKNNKWPQEWQDEAIEITQQVFEHDYQGSSLPYYPPSPSVDTVSASESNKVNHSSTSSIDLLISPLDQYFLFSNVHPTGLSWNYSG